jgi:L-lysine 2,3-aminomutase
VGLYAPHFLVKFFALAKKLLVKLFAIAKRLLALAIKPRYLHQADSVNIIENLSPKVKDFHNLL